MSVEILQLLGLFGVLITAAGAIIVALVSRIKSPEEVGAIKAETLAELVGTVSSISSSLSAERDERLKDCIRFDKEIANLREFYSTKISASEAAWEIRIKRLEQAHRDRVEALKSRIRALEDIIEAGGAGPV